MSFSPETLAELDVLMHFNLKNHMEGIKIHHEADPALVAAAKRLFERGFITQTDGGYLTPLGNTAAEHAQALFTLLNAHRRH